VNTGLRFPAARRDSPLRICIVADFPSLQQFLLSSALDLWCSRLVFTAREFLFAARMSPAGSLSVSAPFFLLRLEFLTASPPVSTPTLFSLAEQELAWSPSAAEEHQSSRLSSAPQGSR
jgi:hypothetical protein